MAYNKVIAYGKTLIDVSQDTVTPDTLQAGYTAHNKAGEQITGTAEAFVPDGYIQPSGSVTITQNGEHDIKQYEKATVNVPIPDGYIKPSGSVNITGNGSHNVTQYENAVVNVPIPEGYIKPSGSLEITENGTYDITDKTEVVINVASSGGEQPTPRELTITMPTTDVYFGIIHNDTTYYSGDTFTAMTGDTLGIFASGASCTYSLYINGEKITEYNYIENTWTIPLDATSITIPEPESRVESGWTYYTININYTTDETE